MNDKKLNNEYKYLIIHNNAIILIYMHYIIVLFIN